MSITVYGKQNCKQCEFTKKFLDLKHASFVYEDLTDNIEKQIALKEKYNVEKMSLPFVVTDTATWSGFQPYKLAKAIK